MFVKGVLVANKKIYIENRLLFPVHLHFTIDAGALIITVDKFGRENEECLMPGHTAIFEDHDAILGCVHDKKFSYGFRNETGGRLTVIPGVRRALDGPIFELTGETG